MLPTFEKRVNFNKKQTGKKAKQLKTNCGSELHGGGLGHSANSRTVRHIMNSVDAIIERTTKQKSK